MDRVPIGGVVCDFMSRQEFLELCSDWLQSSASHHVVTLNAEMVVLAQRDAAFRLAANAAAVCAPEGGPIWARSYLQSSKQSIWRSLWMFMRRPAERLTGVDMVWDLGRLAADSGQLMYLLGGTVAQNMGAAQALRTVYPNLALATSPAHDFELGGPAEIVDDINAHQPAILLVAYGAPKQTLWIERHKDELPSVRIAVGVGGALAMIAGDLPRAPRGLRQVNLEWVWRLWLEPQRFGRIWRAVVIFPQIINRQKVGHKLF